MMGLGGYFYECADGTTNQESSLSPEYGEFRGTRILDVLSAK